MTDKKKNHVAYFVFAAILFIWVAVCTRGGYYYGSRVDWVSQHYLIPSYFRMMFYHTGHLMQSFALNLGAGQSIYNLAYYGYLSPVILFSYALPFVSMKTYVIGASLVCDLASVILIFRWLREKFTYQIAFLTALLFELSSPLMVHTHKHVMFIIYMPFLIIAMWSAEKYLLTEDGKKRLKHRIIMIIAAFLVIMCNYFFAVSALFAVCVFGAATLFGNVDRALMLSRAAGYAVNLLISLFMSAILVVPVMDVIFQNRAASTHPALSTLLTPKFGGVSFLYGFDSIGLTAVFMAAVMFAIISGSRDMRILGCVFIVFAFIPGIDYILNGGLYIDGKVFIPFLPAACIVTASFLQNAQQRTYNYKKLLAATAVLATAVFMTCYRSVGLLFFVDLTITMLFLAVYNYGKLKQGLMFLIISLSILTAVTANSNELLVKKDKLSDLRHSYEAELTGTATADMGSRLYRVGDMVDTSNNLNEIFCPEQLTGTVYSSVENRGYNSWFWRDIYNENGHRNAAMQSQTQNPLYNLFIGNRYIVSESTPAGWYRKVASKGTVNLYKSDYAYPVCYATSDVISNGYYKGLSDQDKSLAMLTGAVFGNSNTAGAAADLIHAAKIDDAGYTMTNRKITFKKRIPAGKLLMISMKVMPESRHAQRNAKSRYTGRNRDISITIGDIKNKLTDPAWKYNNRNYVFHYVYLEQKKIKSIDIIDSGSSCSVSDVEIYTADPQKIKTARRSVDPLTNVRTGIKGNVLSGRISVKRDGIFVASIPYDKGLEIYVDGKRRACLKTDAAFIGCRIAKGVHKVSIVYKKKAINAGAALSLAGLTAFGLIIIIGRRREK